MIYLQPGCELKDGQAVRVYRNLRKKLFSIQDKKTRRVIAYANNLILKDAEMIVYQSGKEKVRKVRQKNVHAFIVGKYVNDFTYQKIKDIQWEPIYYNPYITDTFVYLLNRKPVYQADLCYLDEGKCYICNHKGE